MIVAVTGATGGVGTELVSAALARGDGVRALVRDVAKAEHLAKAGAKLVRGDLADEAALEELARGADALVHAAAHVGDWGDEETFEEVNVGGTRRAVEAAARAKVKRFVHVSSVAYYGRPESGTIDEAWPPRPHAGAYERSKFRAERLAFERGAELGLEVAAVRPPVIVGKHDRVFMPRALNLLRKRRVVFIDDGEAPFNLVDVADVVDVVLRCTERREAIGEAFNVAAAPPTFREIVHAIADAAKLPLPRFSIPRSVAIVVARVLDDAFKTFGASKPPPLTPFMVTILTLHIVYDASKARRVLGWSGGRDPLDVVRECAAALA